MLTEHEIAALIARLRHQKPDGRLPSADEDAAADALELLSASKPDCEASMSKDWNGINERELLSASKPAVQSDERMSDAMRELIEGMSVSVDVSTCDADAGNRYFGTVTEVMDCDGDKHGVTLLVQNAEPNFEVTTQPAKAGETLDTDFLCVDSFAEAMKQKLLAARQKGRSGWQHCDPEDLSRMLREHVEKGDPRDVANFCMMLWHLSQPISAPSVVVLGGERVPKGRESECGK